MARESVVDEEDAKKAFAQLKPLCVDVLRSLSVENLGRLNEALRRLHRLAVPLVEYVLFPLRSGIRRLAGSDKVLLEALLSSISLVLSRASPGKLSLPWDIFQELFVFLSMLLDSRMSEEAGFGTLTEERVQRALLALQSLLLSSSESSLSQLYHNLPAVGHCVSVMVSSLQAWGSREVGRAALMALLALTGLREADIAMFTGDPGGEGQDTADSLRALCERLRVGGRGDGGRGGDSGRGGEGDYIGETLASFLPGVTIAISKLLTTSANLGQSITNLCLLVWTRYVSLVMDDRVLLHEESRDESEVTRAMRMAGERKTEPSETSPTPPREHTVTPSHPHKDHALRVDRSRQWRVETDKKLGMLAHKMVAVLVTGDGWRGRRGVVLWAHCLLGNCHRSLVTMAPILLEALLSLSHDGYQQVSMAATISLDMFSAQHADEVGSELAAVLEERLYALASSLPRLMRQHDDVQKASTLQLLAGYLQLLGPHTLTLTHSHAHLSRITQALVQTLELDASDSHIVEEVPTPHESADKLNESLHPQGPGENGAISSGPRGPTGDCAWWTLSLHYKQFRLPQVETLIQHCCQLLGFLGSLPTLLDHLLDMYRTSTHQRSELLVIIGHALLGAAGRGCVQGKRKPPHAVCGEEMCELVEGVLEEVTGEGWRGRGGGGGGEEGGESTPASATLLQCLQLQVVDVCVRLLRASFLPHLQTQAYLLLARAGSPLPEVSSLALATLTTVASCTEESSLAQLITSSADYLVNCVALTLRGHTHKQEALQVLQAVLEHGAREVLPLMRDSIEELLLCLDLQLLDNEGVWSVLRSLAAAVHRWSSELMEGKSGSDGSGCHGEVECGGREEVECGDVKSYFLEYCHNKHSEQEEEGEGEQEGLGDTQEGVVAPQTLSPADQAAVDVLQHCPHFLPSHSPPLSHHNPTSSLTPSPPLPPSVPLRVLDCLSHCLHALRHNQQALLPEVHKVWPSFVLRLSDSSPPVALRAVEVLWDMCEVCGDFVRRRVVKEVWPVIAQSLTRLAAGSWGADGRYRFSASCRLQLKMLESVGILPGKLQVGAADLEVLIHSCLPYLSCNQPSSLLETCKASLTALTRLDPDTMWLLLHQLVPMETKHPPHPSLPPYKFARLADGDEFTEAGSHLLQLTLSHSL